MTRKRPKKLSGVWGHRRTIVTALTGNKPTDDELKAFDLGSVVPKTLVETLYGRYKENYARKLIGSFLKWVKNSDIHWYDKEVLEEALRKPTTYSMHMQSVAEGPKGSGTVNPRHPVTFSDISSATWSFELMREGNPYWSTEMRNAVNHALKTTNIPGVAKLYGYSKKKIEYFRDITS